LKREAKIPNQTTLSIFLQPEFSKKNQFLIAPRNAVPFSRSPSEHGKKALKRGEPKGGVKNFTLDDWKEECAE